MKSTHYLLLVSCVSCALGCSSSDSEQPKRGLEEREVVAEAKPAAEPAVEPVLEPATAKVRAEIFDKGNHALLDDRLSVVDMLEFSDADIRSADGILQKRAKRTPGNEHNRAVLSFVKSSAHTEERRVDWLRRLEREKANTSYAAADLVAELPIGIYGDCLGGGIGEGEPPVSLNKDGTLAGHVESNTTLEDYSGRWQIRDGQLVVDFKVVVQETGDSGDTGKPKTHRFNDQRAFIVTSLMLLNAEGAACWLRRSGS